MFRKYKDKETHMENLYERVNKYYKTVNREMINQIVHRIDDIADIYFDLCHSDLNPQQKRKNENNLLTKRILSNKDINEAATLDTVLNFICAVFHFMYAYKHEPARVFQGT